MINIGASRWVKLRKDFLFVNHVDSLSATKKAMTAIIGSSPVLEFISRAGEIRHRKSFVASSSFAEEIFKGKTMMRALFDYFALLPKKGRKSLIDVKRQRAYVYGSKTRGKLKIVSSWIELKNICSGKPLKNFTKSLRAELSD